MLKKINLNSINKADLYRKTILFNFKLYFLYIAIIGFLRISSELEMPLKEFILSKTFINIYIFMFILLIATEIVIYIHKRLKEEYGTKISISLKKALNSLIFPFIMVGWLGFVDNPYKPVYGLLGFIILLKLPKILVLFHKKDNVIKNVLNYIEK